MADLIDPSIIESMSDSINADEDVTWRMYVPDSYTPSEPAGLLVYVSPTPKGQMPRGWQPVFDEQNLIFISADRSGNRTSTKRRLLFAALAPYLVSNKYEIDASRIYVSGFSGGGKVASLAAIQFANLFAGAMYICGAESWPNVDPALLSEAKQNRYVFVTGSQDFNHALTRKIFRNYEEEGMININLMTIRGMGHETPDEKRFRMAINYLDQHE
jgi:poly(3-hydroxybutyrate) depolymerase